MNWNIIFILFLIFTKVYYSSTSHNTTSIKNKVDDLLFYREYNSQTFDECMKNTHFIDTLILSMKSNYTKDRQRKQKYDNVLELANKCMNDFHSLIYSIPVDERNIVKRFDKDLRIYKTFINTKINKAKDIYSSTHKNNINSFTETVYDTTPLPKDNSFNTHFNFY